MAPKIATYSFRHDTLAAAVVMKKASIEKGEIHIKDPPYDSENAASWYPELHIPKPALNSSVEEQQGTLRRLMLPRENPKIPIKKNKAKNLGPKLTDKRSILFFFRVSTFLNSNIMT